jgi:hypothetical protein
MWRWNVRVFNTYWDWEESIEKNFILPMKIDVYEDENKDGPHGANWVF